MADRLNILFIFTDQHRLSAVGAYGPTVCRTPNIDRLAAEGIRFEHAYTTCPVCSPARATVMTGLYPHAHGITSNVHNLACSAHELADRPALLSRRLESVGYSLGYSGKWHLGTDQQTLFGAPNTPSLPKTVGFEGQNFPGHGNGGHRYAEYLQYLQDRGLEHRIKPWAEKTAQITPMGEEDSPPEATVPYFLAASTICLIDEFRQRGKPFFIWHNNWGPHTPYYAPKEFLDLYRGAEIPPWPNYEWPSRSIPGPHQAKIHPDRERLSWEDWATAIRYYYAFTTLIDDQIGRILRHLEQTHLLEETLIVFSADHGETLGSHGGLTDKGWHHFEETHRIPLIVRLPGKAHAGKVVAELVSAADFYPTFLDVAGVPEPAEGTHGRSLLPLIEGKRNSWRDYVVTEFGGVNHLGMTQRTVRRGSLKYGYNCCCGDELYDLAADPHETRNLIDHRDYQQAAGELRELLLEWMQETHDTALRMVRQHMAYFGRPG